MFVDVPIWKRICGGVGGVGESVCVCVYVRNTLIAQEGTEVVHDYIFDETSVCQWFPIKPSAFNTRNTLNYQRLF